MARVCRSSVLGLILLLQACTWATGIKPTDISSLKTGSSRPSVEEILGRPVLEQETSIGRVVVYQYQAVGVETGRQKCGIDCYELLLPFLWPLMERDSREEAKEGKAFLTVVYNADGKAAHVFKDSGRPDKMLAYIQDASKDDAFAEGRLHLGATLPSSKIYWQCRAATHGSQSYRSDMGRQYELGYGKVPPDKVKAFVWYSMISDSPEDVKSKMDNLQNGMTEDEIRDAQHRVATWKPDISECDRFLEANSG